MASVFEQMASLEPQIVDTSKNGKQSPFQLLAQQEPPTEESFLKSSLRTALQIPQGIAEGTKYGITTGLHQLLGMGEALDPEEMDRIKAISEREGIPFDEQGYLEATQNALGSIPTISNIASQVEKRTGIPLEPKTRVQKGLRFASVASKLAPKDYTFRGMNTALPRPVLGAGIEGAKEVLQETGVPEPFAELASFGVIKPTSAGAGKISIGRETKPSGLTTRQYEKLKNPKEVSGSAIQRINEKTEKEFRDITNKIIEDSPIKDTYHSLKNDVTFKQESVKAFEDVQALSESLPAEFETQMVKQQLVNSVLEKKSRGITPSEFDVAHKNFIVKMLKDTPDRKITTSDLVTQYRKNNKQLSEAYEPGQSFAYNRAKREALLDYNRTIASIFEKEFPNTEFTNLFKETNKRWSEISDAEAIDKFLDGMFKGKIQYQKGRQFFDKQGMTVPFKRAMGEEGFAKFETLMKDLMSTEQASKLLREAKSKGFGDLAQTAGAYILHPSLAKGKLAVRTLKDAYNTIFSMVIDKPQLAITWDRGINAMKAGNFKAAEKEFGKIRAAEQAYEAEKAMKAEILPKEASTKTKESKTFEIEPEIINESPKSKAIREFKLYGMKDSVEYGIGIGEINKFEDIESFLRREMPRRVSRMEEEAGKPFNEILKDIYNPKEFSKKDTKTRNQKESKQEEIQNKQIELKKSKLEEGREFRDRFMQKETGNEVRDIEAKRKETLNKFNEKRKEQTNKKKNLEPILKKVERPDISSKGLKKQKDYILSAIDKALAEPTNKEKIEIKVPGDGEFKINNNQDSLNLFKKRVNKYWPLKQSKARK